MSRGTQSGLCRQQTDLATPRQWQELAPKGAGRLRKAWRKKFADIQAIDAGTFRLTARLRHIFRPSGSGGPGKGSKNEKGALKTHQVYCVGDESPADPGIGPAREHDEKGIK